jgi:hypothetical protein
VPVHTPRNHTSEIALIGCLKLNPYFLRLTHDRLRRWRGSGRAERIALGWA